MFDIIKDSKISKNGKCKHQMEQPAYPQNSCEAMKGAPLDHIFWPLMLFSTKRKQNSLNNS